MASKDDDDEVVPELERELNKLERTDPQLASAAKRFEAMKKYINSGRRHPLPCTIPDCEWHHPKQS